MNRSSFILQESNVHVLLMKLTSEEAAVHYSAPEIRHIYRIISENKTSLNKGDVNYLKGLQFTLEKHPSDNKEVQKLLSIIPPIINTLMQPKTSSENSNFVMFLKIGANKGDIGALKKLGFMYRTGYRAPLNLFESFTCYLKAAELNDKEAMHIVGEMYEKGLGVQKDKKLASNWKEKANTNIYKSAL